MFQPRRFVRQFKERSRQNAADQRRCAIRKVIDILTAAKTPTQIRHLSQQTYKTLRRSLASGAHISVNVNTERFMQLLKDGVLPTTGAENQFSKLFRRNSERAFGVPEAVSPIYGALNWQSAEGAAPSFEPKLWLRLGRHTMERRATFTARDSYNIVLPYLPNFQEDVAAEKLLREVYVWNDVLDACLNRFGVSQDTSTCDYIEVQVWGPVTLNDVVGIYVLDKVYAVFADAIESLNVPVSRKKRVLGMLHPFVKGGRL